MIHRLAIHHSAKWGRPLARIAGSEALGLCGKLGCKGVSHGFNDYNPFGRHANLALIHEGTKGSRLHGFIQISILQHNQRRLTAQFQQARLEMFGRTLCDDPADGGGPGKVDPLDRRRIDQRAHHIARIGRRIGDDVYHALREACFSKGFDNDFMRARAGLACLEDNSIAAGQRHGYRAHAQDDRCIPWRDAQNHAHGFAQRHSEAARLIRRDDLTRNLCGQSRSFPHNGGSKAEIEERPALGRTDFGHHRFHKGVRLGLKRSSCLHENGAARIWAGGRPNRKGSCCLFGNGRNVRGLHCRRAGGNGTGNRVDTLKLHGRSPILL